MNNGKVTGVEARDAKGNTIILHAKKVIIATGGFAANKEMLAQNVTDSSRSAWSNQFGSAGR